jgi:hypothetical protein
LVSVIIITSFTTNFLNFSNCILILEMLIAIRRENDVNEERVIYVAVKNNQIHTDTVISCFAGATGLKYFNADRQIWIA